MIQDIVQMHFDEGEIEKGLSLWRSHLKTNHTPPNLLEYLHLLIPLYRFTEARDIAQALGNHPDSTPTHLLPAAKLFFSCGQLETSTQLTTRAYALNPHDPDLTAIHAANLERTHQRPLAKSLLLNLLKKHPDHLRSIRLLAHVYGIEGNLRQARIILEKRIAGKPSTDDWRLSAELASILERLGEPEEAIAQINFSKGRFLTTSANLRREWLAVSQRQWQVTLRLDHDCLTRWSQPIEDPTKICFLAGFPRSGTTLLERILTTSPQAIGTDESGVLTSQFRNPLILMASSAQKALAELDDFDKPSLQAGRQEYLRATTEAIGQPINDRLLIEKDPLLTADLAVPLRLFPESKIILPLRDPRDVVISYYFTIVPASVNSVASATLEDCCLSYAMTMRHWLWIKEILPPHRWLESKYESLLTSPESHTQELARFLEIPWIAEMLNHSNRDASRAISTPTYADVARPLYTRASGRWTNDPKQHAPHLHHLEPFLREFGYDL